jgi:hypothetical protein
VGIAMISRYENTSGSSGGAPEMWPAEAQIARDHNRDTLIMFAHPKCPCTRASMEDLNRLLAQSGGRVAAHVLFFKPGDLPADWARTDLWRTAAAIPGVSVQDDLNGALARRFGAETSGYVLLYDAAGRLLFRGGITGGRGHAGDNAGMSAVISLVRGESVGQVRTPVYGCSLLSKTCSPPETRT